MAKSIVAEGKTTNEAIEKGLKLLNVSKNMVDVKVLESEDKRSFFSILSPRVVKVELALKEGKEETQINKQKREIKLSSEEQEKAEKNVEKFLKEFKQNIKEDMEYKITKTPNGLNIDIVGEKLGFLIGYRGETLYAMQNILSSIASKGIKERVRIILDIEGYKNKREKTLEELAVKMAKTVIRTRKPIKLEPMQAYERKIIHTKLQENDKVETISVGEEPNRRILISLKNN